MAEKIGKYEIIKPLGKGATAVVYLAKDPDSGREVAVKLIRFDENNAAMSRRLRKLFQTEGSTGGRLDHPNIVRIYESVIEPGQAYIVMEYIEGRSLEEFCAINRLLPMHRVIGIIFKCCLALDHAFRQGVVHRDIKPENIMLTAGGEVKVADFGLARFKGEKPKPGEVWGTPYYVAPEVVRGQSPNAPSDIYSLGGTLYHILTGEPPFNGETVTDTVLLRFKEPAPDPREFKPSISPKTVAILLRMLQMDPFARYPTYESLLKDISDSLAPLLDARSGKKKGQDKKSALVPVLLSLVALAFIGGGVYFGMHVFKAKQAEKQRQAQQDADIAAGKLKRVMRDGKLVLVPVVSSASTGATATADAIVNDWSIPASTDTSVSGDSASADFKERTILLMRAGNVGTLEEASKIYLRFSLEGVDRKRLDQAALQLTAGRKGSVKVKSNFYKLLVWALKSPPVPVWDDLLTWETAPANDTKSSGGMQADKCVLLTSFDIPANPETGDRFLINLKPLIPFLQDFPDNEVTLVLTGDMEYDHKGGWRITSVEDSGRFPPPTLILKAK